MVQKQQPPAPLHPQQRRVLVHRRVVLQLRVGAAAHNRRDLGVHAVLDAKRHVREAANGEALEQRHVEVVAMTRLDRQVVALHLGAQLLVVANLWWVGGTVEGQGEEGQRTGREGYACEYSGSAVVLCEIVAVGAI